MQYEGQLPRRQAAVAITGFLLLFVVGGLIHAAQMSVPPDSHRIRTTTIMKHINSAEQFERGGLYIANAMLYEILNAAHDLGVPRPITMAIVLGISTAVVWYVTFRYARSRIGTKYTSAQLGLIAALTMVVNSLYIPEFSRAVYLGKWGPNVYHNPTHTLVLAFAVPVFIAIGHLAAAPGEKKAPWAALLISVVLALSIYAKPTFMIVAAPATVLYLLFTLGLSRRTILLLVALLAVPTIYLLLIRHWALTMDASRLSGRSNAIAPFLVWNRWAASVPLSMAMTFAFPVTLAVSAWREHRFGRHFGYAWMLCLVATTMAALLIEVKRTGEYEFGANWFSGYLLANHMLYLAAIVEFFDWRSNMGDAGRRRLRYRLCALLLVWHAFSGAVYISRLPYMHGVGA